MNNELRQLERELLNNVSDLGFLTRLFHCSERENWKIEGESITEHLRERIQRNSNQVEDFEDNPNTYRLVKSIGPRAIPPLIDLMTQNNFSTFFRASTAMSELGESAETAIPFFIRLLSHSNPFFKIQARWVLPRIGNHAILALLAVLRSQQESTETILEALTYFGAAACQHLEELENISKLHFHKEKRESFFDALEQLDARGKGNPETIYGPRNWEFHEGIPASLRDLERRVWCYAMSDAICLVELEIDEDIKISNENTWREVERGNYLHELNSYNTNAVATYAKRLNRKARFSMVGKPQEMGFFLDPVLDKDGSNKRDLR